MLELSPWPSSLSSTSSSSSIWESFTTASSASSLLSTKSTPSFHQTRTFPQLPLPGFSSPAEPSHGAPSERCGGISTSPLRRAARWTGGTGGNGTREADVELMPLVDVPATRVESDCRPITCTLYTASFTFTAHLDFAIFRRWVHFAALLAAWGDELGVSVPQGDEKTAGYCVDGGGGWYIYDPREEMCVQAGDWEARVRPGWYVGVYDVRCVGGWWEHGGSWSEVEIENDSDSDEEFEDDDGYTSEKWCDLEKGGEERLEGKEWWFLRWRRGVERGKKGSGRRGGWVVGVVGVLGVVSAFWVVLGLVGAEW